MSLSVAVVASVVRGSRAVACAWAAWAALLLLTPHTVADELFLLEQVAMMDLVPYLQVAGSLLGGMWLGSLPAVSLVLGRYWQARYLGIGLGVLASVAAVVNELMNIAFWDIGTTLPVAARMALDAAGFFGTPAVVWECEHAAVLACAGALCCGIAGGVALGRGQSEISSGSRIYVYGAAACCGGLAAYAFMRMAFAQPVVVLPLGQATLVAFATYGVGMFATWLEMRVVGAKRDGGSRDIAGGLSDESQAQGTLVARDRLEERLHAAVSEADAAWLRGRGLSKREFEAVCIALCGVDVRKAAEHYGIKPSTVGEYARRASVKLGIDSIGELPQLLAGLSRGSRVHVASKESARPAFAWPRIAAAFAALICALPVAVPLGGAGLERDAVLALLMGTVIGLVGAGLIGTNDHDTCLRPVRVMLVVAMPVASAALVWLRAGGAGIATQEVPAVRIAACACAATVACAVAVLLRYARGPRQGADAVGGFAPILCLTPSAGPLVGAGLAWAWEEWWRSTQGLSFLAAFIAFAVLLGIAGVCYLVAGRKEPRGFIKAPATGEGCPWHAPSFSVAIGIGMGMVMSYAIPNSVSLADPLAYMSLLVVFAVVFTMLGVYVAALCIFRAWIAPRRRRAVFPNGATRVRAFLVSKGLTEVQAELVLGDARGVPVSQLAPQVGVSRSTAFAARRDAYAILEVATHGELVELLETYTVQHGVK